MDFRILFIDSSLYIFKDFIRTEITVYFSKGGEFIPHREACWKSDLLKSDFDMTISLCKRIILWAECLKFPRKGVNN